MNAMGEAIRKTNRFPGTPREPWLEPQTLPRPKYLGRNAGGFPSKRTLDPMAGQLFPRASALPAAMAITQTDGSEFPMITNGGPLAPLDVAAVQNDVVCVRESNDAPNESCDEDTRWLQYVASMDERVAKGEITPLQHNVFRNVWSQARTIFPTLRYPSVGRSENCELQLGWSFTDKPGLTFTIDIGPDGSIDWFYRDTTAQIAQGSDASEYHITADTLNFLAPFQK